MKTKKLCTLLLAVCGLFSFVNNGWCATGKLLTIAPTGRSDREPRVLQVWKSATAAHMGQLTLADDTARSDAAIQLGRMKAASAVAALANVLAKDASPMVRDSAARALGLIGSPESLSALTHAAVTQSTDPTPPRNLPSQCIRFRSPHFLPPSPTRA